MLNHLCECLMYYIYLFLMVLCYPLLPMENNNQKDQENKENKENKENNAEKNRFEITLSKQNSIALPEEMLASKTVENFDFNKLTEEQKAAFFNYVRDALVSNMLIKKEIVQHSNLKIVKKNGGGASHFILFIYLSKNPTKDSIQNDFVKDFPENDFSLKGIFKVLKRDDEGFLDDELNESKWLRKVAQLDIEDLIVTKDYLPNQFIVLPEKLRINAHTIDSNNQIKENSDKICPFTLSLPSLGRPLESFTKNDLLNPFTNHLMEKIGNVLATLHARGVLHNDTNSGNVFYDEATDRIFLIDAGGMTDKPLFKSHSDFRIVDLLIEETPNTQDKQEMAKAFCDSYEKALKIKTKQPKVFIIERLAEWKIKNNVT